MPNHETISSANKSAAAGVVGKESALSNWVGPYVTDMLGKGQAVGNKPYEAYGGPLTAGPSALQQQAFQGVANLTVPTQQMGAYTPQTFGAEQASQYMNPYVQEALQPQLQELQRQQEIKRVANAGRLTQAGAYGGGRQAIMESELDRAGLDQASKLTGNAYLDAYSKAQGQFNVEQDRQKAAQQQNNTYGLAALQRQADLGTTQRGIESAGVAADMKQFEEERAYPYKQIQYQQGLLQGLPLSSQSYNFAQPTALESYLSAMTGVNSAANQLSGSLGGSSTGGVMGVWDQLKGLFGGDSDSSGASAPVDTGYADTQVGPNFGPGALDYLTTVDIDEQDPDL